MGKWKFDPYHTQVEFSAKHLGMMTVRGHFAEVTATGEIDVEHPEHSKIEATINTLSIRTHNETRDNDLRSGNFLEAEKCTAGSPTVRRRVSIWRWTCRAIPSSAWRGWP